MSKLLIVDDEPAIRFSVQRVFRETDVEVIVADSATEAVRRVAEDAPDVVLLDIRLGTDDGLKVFEQLRQQDAKCLVIFITGHGTAETAIEAMKRGAYDYLVKPLDSQQLQDVVRQACEISQLMRKPAIVEEGDRVSDQPDLLIGSGPQMRTVFKQIGRIAPQDVNVLILGESGTGKELVARAIYHHSRRNQGPFLAINCAALTESLLESELFGHERGAFTGADRRRIGKFEQANGGTLFLDEVGDMTPATQAKLLRLLQDGSFERVGGNESLQANVRVLAATNKGLERMVETGSFRLDLYYRLRGVTIALPALRDRKDDIPELAHYFLFRLNRELGCSVSSISEEALLRLANYRWPGNVRELQSVIRESLIRSAGSTLLPEFLPDQLSRERPVPQTVPIAPTWDALAADLKVAIAGNERGVYRRALEHFDRIVINAAMTQTHGNQVAASELLGISRPTLRDKLRRLQRDADAAPDTIAETEN